MYDFLRSHTARIEVCVNGGLQREYFPIKPVCGYIAIKTRDYLMLSVNRDSQETKVTELMAACPELIDEMNLN